MKNLCPVSRILILIGAINLGLIGIGDFVGTDLDAVNIVLGNWPIIVSIFNVLVGLSAVMVLVKGKKCSM